MAAFLFGIGDMAATDDGKDLGGLEKSLEELEALVTRLESGDLPLEQALKEGYTIASIESDPDLRSVRSDPRYQALKTRATSAPSSQ